jgi:CubicO group peptidase (beta-lactamase class C family)
MQVKAVLSALLTLWLTATLLAQADPIDALIRAEMKRQNIPGLSLAVLKRGAVVKADGYGFSNIRQKTPASPQTVYKIASVSKQFIASAIMRLVQDGQLGVDDPIAKYLAGVPEAWNGITIRHALTHTGGLVREAPGFDPFKVQSDAEVIRTAYAQPLRFAPGEKWEYSNLGYFALGEIIRKVSGQSWPDYVAEKIFKPTGMHSTFPTNTKQRIPTLTLGYVDNDALRDAPDWKALRASGAFLSTVLDLAKWDAMLYSGAVLSEASRRQMWTPVALNDGRPFPYGFGWRLEAIGGHRAVHHSGGMPGARSMFARFPDQGLTIIILTNLDDVDIDAIVVSLTKLLLPPRKQ